jgi:hypothetical protein
MGMSAYAHLAYGYDLGTSEDFRAAERGEYGSPKLAWMPVDEDGDSVYEDFGSEVEKRLLASVGFAEEWSETETEADRKGRRARKAEAKKRVGVELDFSGGDYPGWMLIASGSERNVEWDEAMALDLDELTGRPAAERWPEKLTAALEVLGITPIQVRAKWLVYPSYG